MLFGRSRSQTDKPFGVDLLLPKSVAAPAGGDVQELPLSEVLKKLPEPHQRVDKEGES